MAEVREWGDREVTPLRLCPGGRGDPLRRDD